MPYITNERMQELRKLWDDHRAVDVGRLVLDSLPKQFHPQWAAGILRLFVSRIDVECAPCKAVLSLALRPQDWGLAHEAFAVVRKAALRLPGGSSRSHEQKLLLHQLALAELVAKVIYNATDPPDPFDDDSGWWIVSCAREIVDFLNDSAFTAQVWSLICLDGVTLGLPS